MSYFCRACKRTVWILPSVRCNLCNGTDIGRRLYSRTEEEVSNEQRRAFEADKRPAPRSSIENMEKFTITKESSMKTQSECPVCMVDFEIGKMATSMNCGHFFHHECIATWLEKRNVCPICKANLPLEDTPIYSRLKPQGGGSSSSSSRV